MATLQRLREAWMEADASGVDRIYACDHFFTVTMKRNPAPEDTHGKSFEAMAIQAAMAP